MSKPVVIIALLLAVVLAGVALLLSSRDRPRVVRGPVLGLEPAHVIEVRASRPGGRFEAARRGTDPGSWVIVLGDGKSERTWPADATRTRAALRILSTLEFSRPAQNGDAPGVDATPVTIALDDGSSKILRVSSRSLAGQTLAGVEGGATGWIGAEVADMLVKSGPSQWRDAAALSIGPEVARISLKGAASSVSLGRVQGRWALREPIQEPAEPEAVAKLTTALGGILITDFLDQGSPGDEQTGLEPPVAVLSAETDLRDAEGSPARTIKQSLRAGRAADIAGRGIYAAVDRDGGERIVIVAADSLAAIITDPAAYIARRAVQAAAPDVGEVQIEPASEASPGLTARTFRRTLDGWTTTGPSGEAPATPSDAQRIAATLDLLIQTRAETVIVGLPKPAPAPVAMIRLRSLGGADIAGVTVGVVSEGPSRHLVVTQGEVTRLYGAAAEPVLAWLAPQ